ncbi:ligand-gated channel [Oxalicibacterium flavum]|uniref:Ligand-gated channel n=1 Tax=Oxalicibacterium flavum TaxID=179467 RepID=A0A8J2ULI0_9BURK|nr:TonB-dependent receptor [Oxalicibacterium flavum]GGC12806.1 ligand-gated channel [Oxalicibacterium flavum]
MKPTASHRRCAGTARRGIFHRKLLALSLQQAMLGMAVTSLSLAPVAFGSHAMAQTAATARTHYAIPAGPLEGALAAFARTSGVLVAYTPDLVAGVHSAGLSGDYAIDEALHGLLAGTGLAGVATGGGKYTLRRLPPSDTASTTLPAVEVNARLDGTTEGTDSYAARAATVGKTAQSLREIPQSVTVITRKQLDDQNLHSIEDALKNVTGVTVQRFDAAGHYSVFNARGFGSDTYQMDGVTLQTDANGVYLDLAVFDRVEVLRGASGMFSGAGEPGVTINLARKRALAPFKAEASASVGSWNNLRAELDVTGALVESGRVRGRLVTLVQDYDTYMDNVDGSKKLVYGTVEADLSENTTLSLGATWQDVRSVLSRGLPTWADGTLIDLPRSVMPVQHWNRQRLETRSYFAELEHHTDNDALLKFTLRRSERGNRAKYTDPSPPDANGLMTALASSAFIREDTDNSADLYFNTPLQGGGRTHNLLVGADWRETDNRTNYAPYGVSALESVNLFSPNPYAIPEPDFDYDTNVSRTRVQSHGVYGQFRYKAGDALTLIGGGRVSWWKSSGVSNGTPSGYEEKGEFTPYAGVIWDLVPTLSLYSSYSQIFKPQNSLTVEGEQIKPRTGSQVEVGLKGESDGGKVQYSAALYRIVDENRALADPENNGFSIAAGKARSQGLEAEVRGQVTRQWNLAAGYAYTSTKYLRSTAEQQGQTYSTFTPRHNVNLWAQYEVPASVLPGLDVGMGMRIVSDFYSQSGAITVRGPGYGVAALRAGYKINDRYRLALNIDNLFDRKYWEKVSGTTRQNFYGAPRSVTLTLRGSF